MLKAGCTAGVETIELDDVVLELDFVCFKYGVRHPEYILVVS